MRLLFSSFLLLFFISLVITGCKDSITGSQLDSVVIPSSNVSYKTYIQPVFTLKCANSGCHDDGTMAAGLSLTTWAGATNLQYVTKGHPDNSILVQSIEGLSGSSPMPPVGYPVMTANQIQGVRVWIAEGAKNN